MTQIDAVVFMRGRGWTTSTSSIGRWEADGSIPLDEAIDLVVVVGYGASLDAVVTRAAAIAAEQARRLAAVDPAEVAGESGREEQPRPQGSRRARRGGAQRGAL